MPEDPTPYRVTKENSGECLENKENSEECSRSEKNSGECLKNSKNSEKCLQTGKQAPTIPSLTIRINNLQFRSTSQSSGEFIKWFPNSYYNNLLFYLDNGWEDHGDFIKNPTSSYSLSKNMFSSSEHCIVIAFLEVCKDENCCELTSVGPRLLDLTLQERDQFFEVYTLAETKLLNLYNESENEN